MLYSYLPRTSLACYTYLLHCPSTCFLATCFFHPGLFPIPAFSPLTYRIPYVCTLYLFFTALSHFLLSRCYLLYPFSCFYHFARLSPSPVPHCCLPFALILLPAPYAPGPVFTLLLVLQVPLPTPISTQLVETITLGGRLIKGFYAPQEIHSETTDSFYLEKRRGFSCSSPSSSSSASLLFSYNHRSYFLSAFMILFAFSMEFS